MLSTYTNTKNQHVNCTVTVQASASQGDEIALVYALFST